MSDWFGTHSAVESLARRARPGDAGPAARRGQTCSSPSTPATCHASWIRGRPRARLLGGWTAGARRPGPRSRPPTTRRPRVDPAAAARGMVLLPKGRAGRRLPLAATARRVAADRSVRPLRPAAGWRQRTRAARPRPRPLDALVDGAPWLRRHVRAAAARSPSTCRPPAARPFTVDCSPIPSAR